MPNTNVVPTGAPAPFQAPTPRLHLRGLTPKELFPLHQDEPPLPHVEPQGQAGGHQLSQPQGSHGTFIAEGALKSP